MFPFASHPFVYLLICSPHVTFALSKAYKLPVVSTNFRVFCCTRDKELLCYGVPAMIRTLKAKSQQDIKMAMLGFVLIAQAG